MTEYQAFAQQAVPVLERLMNEKLAQDVCQPDLRQAMAYSVNSGGKRLRPLLLLSVVQTFRQLDMAAYLPAGALELIQTYSLIHDDLPAMDDDDLRRGQPASHKKFGEGQAILAGDGLLTLAFQWLSEARYSADVNQKLVHLLSTAAGPSAMVAGQYTDIQTTAQQVDQTVLKTMEEQKTAALINAAVLMGAVIAQVSKPTYEALNQFGAAFGLAFQIADDLADYQSGQDKVEHKATFATMLGVPAAKNYLKQTLADAKAALATIKTGDLSLLESYFTYFEKVL